MSYFSSNRSRAAGVAAGLALVAASCAAAAAAADKYPVKPVRLIVPFVAGAGTDITGRTIAQKLTEHFAQQFVVDNRPGAAGAIGAELTAQAAPDGYTLCLISASHSVNSATNRKLSYDLLRDLQPVSQATSLFYVMYVTPAVPAKTVREFVAYARANPGKLNFGSSGTGGLQHLAGEMFNYLGQVKMVHVPYKGGAAVITDALAGNIQVGYGTLLSLRTHFKSGRLRGLAVSSGERSPAAPELPTIAESGLKGYDVDQWYGVITGARVPRRIVEQLSAAIASGIKSPDVAKRLQAEGSTPVGSTPDAFAALIKSEIGKWRKLVTDAKLAMR
jgi:tripartite-type tricarboxylate transporter receptor subunit TctC